MPGPKLSGEPHLGCAWFFFILPLELWRVAVVHVLLPTVLPQHDTEISPQADTLMNPSATPSPPDCSCCGAQGGLDARRTTGWRAFMARFRGWACVSFYCASGCLTGRAAWVPPGPLLQRCSPLTQVRRASTGGHDSASLQVSRTELRHWAWPPSCRFLMGCLLSRIIQRAPRLYFDKKLSESVMLVSYSWICQISDLGLTSTSSCC